MTNLPLSDASIPNQDPPRERILQAALVLFVNQGYFNTNLPDISKESQCSVGSIYHHFLNKEEIARTLYNNGIHQFRRALVTGISGDAPLESVIHQLVTSFLLFAEEHLVLSKYLWLSRHSEFVNVKVSRPTKVGFDTLGRCLSKSLRSGIRQKEIPALRAEIIWSIVFGIPLSFVRDWLEGYTTQTPTQVAPVLSKACWVALKGAKVAVKK